jgi:hypothetical protein
MLQHRDVRGSGTSTLRIRCRDRRKPALTENPFFDQIDGALWVSKDEYSQYWQISEGQTKQLNASRECAADGTATRLLSPLRARARRASPNRSFAVSTTSSPARQRRALESRAGRNLTYGEVLAKSIKAHVIPGLQAGLAGAVGQQVVADLGSGTGKIVVQCVIDHLGMGSKLTLRGLGIEFDQARHDAGAEAMRKAAAAEPKDVEMLLSAAVREGRVDIGVHSIAAVAVELARVLRTAAGLVTLVRGDITQADLSACTLIFVNNKVFEATLMAQLAPQLAGTACCLPPGQQEGAVGRSLLCRGGPCRIPHKLRALVLINALCARHRPGGRCESEGSSCASFYSPVKGCCNPSWDSETTLWWYYPKALPEPDVDFPFTAEEEGYHTPSGSPKRSESRVPCAPVKSGQLGRSRVEVEEEEAVEVSEFGLVPPPPPVRRALGAALEAVMAISAGSTASLAPAPLPASPVTSRKRAAEAVTPPKAPALRAPAERAGMPAEKMAQRAVHLASLSGLAALRR